MALKEVTQSIRNISPETRYIIRVRTVNHFGVHSEWSEALDVVTDDSVIEEEVVEEIDLSTKSNKVKTVNNFGVNHTLNEEDADGYVVMGTASPTTLTVPHENTYDAPIGTHIIVRNVGSGTLSIAAESGVLLEGGTAFSGQHKTVEFMKAGTNAWHAWGDLV